MTIPGPRLTIVMACAALACSGAPEPDATCTDTDLVLQGEIVGSRTLHAHCTYRLAGSYALYDPGAELTIEPGVTVEAEGDFFVRVASGAKLVARGTAEQPITFRATEAARAAGWKGLLLGGADAPVRHELHHTVVRDAGSNSDADDTHPAVVVAPEAGKAEILFDHLTIEDPKHAGLRLYRDGAAIVPGSQDLVVRGAPGYPLVVELPHLRQLPARLSLASTNPARARILSFGGNDGLLTGDHVWARQDVPLELASYLELGNATEPGTLTIEPPATLLLRHGVTLRTTWGRFVFRATPTDAIAFDRAEEDKPWGAVVMVSNHETSLAQQSVIDGVSFRRGGSSDPMVYVLGPGGPGSPQDCSTGATVTGCTFSDPSPDGAPFCFSAPDHSFAYLASNTFSGCTGHVACD